MNELDKAASEVFIPYPKTPRLKREAVITEKLDGSNAQVFIQLASDAQKAGHLEGPFFACVGDYVLAAGSRNRSITPGKSSDNAGFAAWVKANAEELVKLGPGRHFGEWYGAGIQRTYGLTEKRFALFNVQRWSKLFEDQPKNEWANRPDCCETVPVFWHGIFCTRDVDIAIEALRTNGSWAVPGFMKPEGIIVYHTAAGHPFKVLLENDEVRKGE
jgi:hypothetical protein